MGVGTGSPRWSGVATLAFVAVCACQGEDDTIRVETLQLAEGEYAGLSWGGTQVERFFAVARPLEDGNPSASAVLVSPEHQTPCVLGANVPNYTALTPRLVGKYVIGSPSPARIVMFDDEDGDGFGTLNFADIECQGIDLTLPDVSSPWYLYAPDRVKVKLAVLNRERSLIFVDPWAGEQQEVARNLAGILTFETGAWLLEDGELVKRDLDGNATRRIGEHVRDFRTLNSPDDIAYRNDDGGLFLVREGVEKQLANDGCGGQAMDTFMSGAVGYFSPCDSRTLRVWVNDSKAFEYDAGVDLVHTDSGMLLYTTNTETTTKIWLVASALPTSPIELAERPKFAVERVVSFPSGQLLVIVRLQDGTRSVWQLRREDPTHAITEIAAGIVDYQLGQEGVAVLYSSGELVLSDRTLQRVLLRLTSVAPRDFRMIFGGKATGLAYRSNVDERGLGQLELHMLNGVHFPVARDVREFREVWWPERGIVYARGGDEPGIYFTRIEIPCESTSDTAWACGF